MLVMESIDLHGYMLKEANKIIEQFINEPYLENVEKLINAYSSQNNDALVKQMKEIVPEFKSNNSVFTKLD